jgi:hypothetical protein
VPSQPLEGNRNRSLNERMSETYLTVKESWFASNRHLTRKRGKSCSAAISPKHIMPAWPFIAGRWQEQLAGLRQWQRRDKRQ